MDKLKLCRNCKHRGQTTETERLGEIFLFCVPYAEISKDPSKRGWNPHPPRHECEYFVERETTDTVEIGLETTDRISLKVKP